MTTCVLRRSRRKALEWTIRSRSRWKGVRRRHGSSGLTRPRDSYEGTASGDSHRSSCSLTAASKASATLPATSGITVQRSRYGGEADDDRDGAPVGAPGGTRHVTRARRAEEHDDRGDLLRLGHPAERAAGAD